MANNLKKFDTMADYSAATLNYPNVSWVVSGDTLHYAKEAPPAPVVNDKVMMVFEDESNGDVIVLFNCGTSHQEPFCSSITVNDVEVEDLLNCTADDSSVASVAGVNTVKYTLANSTVIADWFSGELGAGSSVPSLEILIPAQITEINYLPDNEITNLVVEATTPPLIEGFGSAQPDASVYVPDDAFNTYMQASGWGDSLSHIYPISQYSGNLPINS